MRRSPSPPHTRRGSIYRTIFLLLPTLLLAALSQSGCGLTLTTAGGPVTPSIATQPTNQTVAVGQTATFFVTASGGTPLSYQWKKSGTAVSGATSPSYTTPSETTSDSGAQFTVVVSNSAGSATSNAATLTVNAGPGAPLQISTSLLANAQAGIQYQASLTATGGAPPYQWSIASGTFPPGLSLNAASGMLSGTPSQGGQFDFSVQVSDSSSPTPQIAMKALTLSVLAFALQITPGGLPNGQVGVPFQTTITGNGGVTPYTWAITGALPSGLSLNASSGGIAGTPTQAGTSAFTIVLTDSTGQTAQESSSITIAAAGPPASSKITQWSDVSTTMDNHGIHYYTFSFPGYAQFKVGDGIGSSPCRGGSTTRDNTSCQGLIDYWDLKNDPTAQWDFGADDTGMFEHQFHINNANATTRFNETKEGPMAVTVTESNNVRVVLTQSGKLHSYGDGSGFPVADCCITMTKTYVFYRHGGAGVGTGAAKVFTKTSLNYDGTDGNGPLTVPTSVMVSKFAWFKVAGETIHTSNSCNSLGTFTLPPWNLINQDPTDPNTDYVFYAPVAKNTSTAGKFIPANTCVSPGASFMGPEGDGGQPSPGTVYNCVTPTDSGCGSQSVSSAVIKATYIQIEQDQRCGLEGLSISNYFYGGYRAKCTYNTTPTLNTNSPVSWLSMGWIGDNGITSNVTATPYMAEYKAPPTMTLTNATGGLFDAVNGYWALGRTSDNVSMSANGLLHSPAFLVSNWTAVSTTLVVGGVSKLQDTDFIAVKTDSTHLLVQYLSNVPPSATIAITPSSAPALQITAGGLPSGQVGTPFQALLVGSGGVTPYTWTVAGALPAGLILNASSGGIAGTPTQAGTYAFTILLTDSAGQTAQASSSIMITAAGPTGTGQVVITPSVPPAVNQGGTFKFTANVPATWSMAPGSHGTIDSDGTYHAPASVKAQQSYGGYQVLPNDHIFNTRIDSLPVNPNSAIWIAGAGTVPLSYQEVSFPINYVNGSTPTSSEVFRFTPGNNGSFQIPAYPLARIESGWFTTPSGAFDRHLLSIDTTNGTFQEMYDIFPAGTLSPPCPTCTSFSGVRYSNSSYGLPNSQGGGVDAAGLYVMPLTLKLQEMEQAVATGGTINHGLRMTLQNGYIFGTGTTRHIWPATAEAFAGGGVVPYGARFRLKLSFDVSKFSTIAQILLTQLKQYGLILADGGTGWATQPEYTRWPATYRAAFNEIRGAGIGPSNFEAVDESGLMVSSTSGLTPAAEAVVATDLTNPAQTASQQVVLTGVTITLPKDALNIQAGTPPQQFTAFINGSSNTNIAWSMSPIVGTLTSGGLYTPPTSVGAATVTTVNAISVADSSVAATMTLTVLPVGTIRLVLGQASPYTDTQGNVWQNEVGDDGCHPYDNGGSWPGTPDITLYKIACFGGNDIRFDVTVPNGNYQITGKFAETENIGVGNRLMDFEADGNVVYSSVDIQASAGGNNLPIDFVVPVTVTNGQLSFVVRRVGQKNAAIISALQIAGVPSH